VHPFALPLLALVATGVFGLIYWLLGIGKDAFIYAIAVLMLYATPVVIVFGVTGLVLGFRSILRTLFK
jgi:hypothetical protein